MKRNYFTIYNLQKVGFISLALGMFISVLFGFIFGLILGTTEMPWGGGDFPTEEMKGRYRSMNSRSYFYFVPQGYSSRMRWNRMRREIRNELISAFS
jgi:hypothetical protein